MACLEVTFQVIQDVSSCQTYALFHYFLEFSKEKFQKVPSKNLVMSFGKLHIPVGLMILMYTSNEC